MLRFDKVVRMRRRKMMKRRRRRIMRRRKMMMKKRKRRKRGRILSLDTFYRFEWKQMILR